LLVFDEGLGVSPAPRSDCRDPDPGCNEIVVSIADLTGPLATRQSAEVTEKQNDFRSFRPEIAEALLDPIGIDDDVVGKMGDIKRHGPAL